jgi:hypothetical protein
MISDIDTAWLLFVYLISLVVALEIVMYGVNKIIFTLNNLPNPYLQKGSIEEEE